MFGALKHHVLKKVGKAGALGFLSGRSDMVGYIDMDKRVGMVFMDDDGQAVIQLVLAVGNDNFTIITAHFFKQRIARGCRG